MDYVSIVNDWYIFDNSNGKYERIAWGHIKGEENINSKLWHKVISYETKK
jgi:hypothetical protein